MEGFDISLAADVNQHIDIGLGAPLKSLGPSCRQNFVLKGNLGRDASNSKSSEVSESSVYLRNTEYVIFYPFTEYSVRLKVDESVKRSVTNQSWHSPNFSGTRRQLFNSVINLLTFSARRPLFALATLSFGSNCRNPSVLGSATGSPST